MPTTLIDFVENLGRKITGYFLPARCVGCRREGTWLCRECLAKIPVAVHQNCLVCGQPAIGGFTHPGCQSRYNPERFLVPFEFRGPLQSAVRRAKYHGTFALLSDLAAIVALWLEQSSIEFLPEAILVPVPLHKFRQWERGYNQSLIFANHLSRNLGLAVDAGLLTRQRYTTSQTQLSPEERRRNVRDVFQGSSEVKGRNIVLVDDVATTGATLLEGARALKHAGARTVWCLTIARGGHSG